MAHILLIDVAEEEAKKISRALAYTIGKNIALRDVKPVTTHTLKQNILSPSTKHATPGVQKYVKSGFVELKLRAALLGYRYVINMAVLSEPKIVELKKSTRYTSADSWISILKKEGLIDD